MNESMAGFMYHPQTTHPTQPPWSPILCVSVLSCNFSCVVSVLVSLLNRVLDETAAARDGHDTTTTTITYTRMHIGAPHPYTQHSSFREFRALCHSLYPQHTRVVDIIYALFTSLAHVIKNVENKDDTPNKCEMLSFSGVSRLYFGMAQLVLNHSAITKPTYWLT